MRVVFLGSPPFAVQVFERLAASRHAIAALVTLPDRPKGRGQKLEESPLVALARSKNVRVEQPANPHEPALLANLRELAPDILVVASYGVILKRELLELAPRGALNVHASLLPRHRGASPIQAAIQAGDRETGVAIQRMVLALDEGDVVVEKRTPIGAEETSGELFERLAVLGGEALVEALDSIEDGRAKFEPQDATRATYAKKIKKEHGVVDWSKPADEIARLVRAMNPWPLARTIDPKGRELAILRAHEVANASGAPGEILESDRRLVVAAKIGALEIEELVPAGKRALAAREFLLGARLERGAKMSSGATR